MKKLIIIELIIMFGVDLYSQRYNTQFNWDTIQFDSSYPFLKIDTSSQNIWQICSPNKVYFDSAFSKEKAIVTDSNNFYPPNNYSFFDLLIGKFNYNYYYPWDIFIEFKHKFDTDSLKDGGYLTISYDNGKNWINIIEDSMSWCGNPQRENENLYTEFDTLFNGEKGFSGKSNGWISTWFAWHQCLVKSSNMGKGDTMILRFNFISDNNNTNKEGWLIDDIRLYSVDLGGAVNDLSKEYFVNIYPNPTNSSMTIDLGIQFGDIIVNVIDISGKSILKKQYSNKKTILIDSKEFLPGIYFIHLVLDREKYVVKKLIIE